MASRNVVRQGKILRPFTWVIVVVTVLFLLSVCAAALGSPLTALLGLLCVVAVMLGWALGVIVASREMRKR